MLISSAAWAWRNWWIPIVMSAAVQYFFHRLCAASQDSGPVGADNLCEVRWFVLVALELIYSVVRLLRACEAFYNDHRPHRALGQAAPLRPLPENVIDLDAFRVTRRDRTGGLLHEYRHVA